MKTLWIILPLVALLMAGCASPGASPDNSAKYQAGEIREYKGARLDPAVGPGDNSINGVQNVDITTYTLTIGGLVDKPVTLTYDEAKKLTPYEQLITLHCVEGWTSTVLWKGVHIKDLIDLAGAKESAVTVIFHAVDGYVTSMPLKEIVDKQMILAYDANGLPLPAQMGFPFIVVAADKYGYKWCRWVDQIRLSDDASYRGYWEQNGFDNDANVPSPSPSGK